MKLERDGDRSRLTLESIYRLPQAQDLTTEAELNPPSRNGKWVPRNISDLAVGESGLLKRID